MGEYYLGCEGGSAATARRNSSTGAEHPLSWGVRLLSFQQRGFLPARKPKNLRIGNTTHHAGTVRFVSSARVAVVIVVVGSGDRHPAGAHHEHGQHDAGGNL